MGRKEGRFSRFKSALVISKTKGSNRKVEERDDRLVRVEPVVMS